jgi:hypothetical protein
MIEVSLRCSPDGAAEEAARVLSPCEGHCDAGPRRRNLKKGQAMKVAIQLTKTKPSIVIAVLLAFSVPAQASELRGTCLRWIEIVVGEPILRQGMRVIMHSMSPKKRDYPGVVVMPWMTSR